MKRLTVVLIGLMVLTAGSAYASNTAHKVWFDVFVGGEFNNGFQNLNYVSPPYFFHPDGNPYPTAATLPTARDWCVDLNRGDLPFPQPPFPPNVLEILRWNPTSSTFTRYVCGQPGAGFDLTPGSGYALVPNRNAVGPTLPDSFPILMVGSHDDTYAPNKPTPTSFVTLLYTAGAGFENVNWVAVPPHAIADAAKVLCEQLNPGQLPTDLIAPVVISIQRFNPQSNTFTKYDCAPIRPPQGFSLIPGQAYGMIPNGMNHDIQIPVY